METLGGLLLNLELSVGLEVVGDLYGEIELFVDVGGDLYVFL